jgi:hypothetical protein
MGLVWNYYVAINTNAVKMTLGGGHRLSTSFVDHLCILLQDFWWYCLIWFQNTATVPLQSINKERCSQQPGVKFQNQLVLSTVSKLTAVVLSFTFHIFFRLMMENVL